MDYYFSTDDMGVSPAECSADPHRLSCQLLESEVAKRDVIAVIRMVVSILSLLGSFSIIFLTIVKKQVCSPKIHPIFMLSIADCLLAVLWTIGGSLWLYSGVTTSKDSERVGCFTVLLMTVILECVAINLTLIYALLAYSAIRQRDFSTVYLLFDNRESQHVWKPWKTVAAYVTAWVVPVILIMVPFGITSSKLQIVKHANNCSCWCLPFFGNVIPYASAGDPPTAQYLHQMAAFIASYGIVVALHYIVGFILLVVIYVKILRRIKKMRKVHEQNRSTHNLYGATEALIIRGQSQAKRRVILFLSVFVVTGFFNLLISVAISTDEIKSSFSTNYKEKSHINTLTLTTYQLVLYMLQSVTVPLQGFLNALVYGWTREDFLHVIVRTRNDPFSVDANNINSPLVQSTNEDDYRGDVFANNSEMVSSTEEHEQFDRDPLYTLTEDTEPEQEEETDEDD